MKIVAMADTHNRHQEVDVPDGDCLIHAGDFTNFGDGKESFLAWFEQLPHPHKILIPGNHEAHLSSVEIGDLVGRSTFHYLSAGTDSVTVDGRTVSTAQAASTVDPHIVVSHAPPAGILGGDLSAPFREIRDRTETVDFDLHIFGHIHEGYGQIRQEDTIFVNASIVIDSPILAGDVIINEPITIDL